jgi:hypothetical protein
VCMFSCVTLLVLIVLGADLVAHDIFARNLCVVGTSHARTLQFQLHCDHLMLT